MDQRFARTGFYPADILLPRAADLPRWSVVACDQYTSQPEYWKEVESIAGGAPSALRLMLPEVYLGGPDEEERIRSIDGAMERYLNGGVFGKIENSFVYIERSLSAGRVRRGLLGAVDLECYDYHRGAGSLIRATEGTVLERIPPRVRVRKNAKLEMPHIMLLIDDPEGTLIEPLGERKAEFEKLYDFELMKDGGHIAGYRVGGAALGGIAEALGRLTSPEAFSRKYGARGPVMAYAAGDGNHSLATAKECWEQLKPGLSAEEIASHPARYALVELVNLHDPSLVFEPIHRVVFGVEPEKLLKAFTEFYPASRLGEGPGQRAAFAYAGAEGLLTCENSGQALPVGMLQAFLDDYTAKHGGKIDYIHGDEVARELGGRPGNIAFLLPAMPKSDLFRAVIEDGALPRKTFSMGHAQEKRYYLECRSIVPKA